MTSYELAQTSRNQQTAEKVTALLIEATNLGAPDHLLTRRQGRKALQKGGSLLSWLKSQRITKAWSVDLIKVRS